MFSQRRILVVIVSIALAACGGNDAGDGAPGSYSLTLAGSVNLVLHPLDQRTLQVVLAQEQTGPVANAQVHFEVQNGDSGGGTLDAADVTTDPGGVAKVTFTAGASPGHGFKIVASAAALGAEPVAFGCSVLPVHRLLQIVESVTTSPKADGESATVVLGASATAALQVRELDADTGAAIAGDTIDFTLPPAARSHWSNATGVSTSATTGAGGAARAFLLTTSSFESAFQIQASSASGGATVTFTVTVAATESGGTCATNQQCAGGEACTGNPPACQPIADGTGCDGRGDESCPAGYSCVGDACQPPAGNECDPTASTCTSGFCCDGTQCISDCSSTCSAGAHCVAGDACGGGTCVSDFSAPDATGVWATKHDFNIAAALPPASRLVFAELRLLDQAILGKLTIHGLPGWLQDIINTFASSLLQYYLPDWFQELVSIGDDLATVLGNLRGEGTIRLARNGDLTHLKGTETWTSLVFYWLPLCGGDIQGDPGQPPECARLDLATSDSLDFGGSGQCKGQALPAITVQIQPFTATIAGSGSGPYTLQVDDRTVKLKMGKVILVLVDYLIAIVSSGQYHCIDEAADCVGSKSCLVDCPGLSNDISNAMDGIISEETLEPLCDNAVVGVGQLVTTALGNVWSPTVDTLDFSGHATISGSADLSSCDDGSPGNCASQLGNDAWDADLDDGPIASRDGSWSGTFFLVKNLPGAWQATRPQ
jgi:hypothetical protein